MLGVFICMLINKYADKTTANDYNQWCSNNNNNQHHSLAGPALDEYRHLLIGTLRYAISKLNQKAIYANMVAFSSKVLGKYHPHPPFFYTFLYWDFFLCIHALKQNDGPTDMHYFSHVFLQDPVRCFNFTTGTTCQTTYYQAITFRNGLFNGWVSF